MRIASFGNLLAPYHSKCLFTECSQVSTSNPIAPSKAGSLGGFSGAEAELALAEADAACCCVAHAERLATVLRSWMSSAACAAGSTEEVADAMAGDGEEENGRGVTLPPKPLEQSRRYSVDAVSNDETRGVCKLGEHNTHSEKERKREKRNKRRR